MLIKDKEIINVLNYNNNIVCVSTRDSSYIIPCCDEDGNPSITPFSPSEIININSTSNAFKSGILNFELDIEKEVYENLLRIMDWQNILKNKEIEDIVINPTVEGLKKIIAISTSSIFERVRGTLTRVKNEGKHDVTNRVDNIITWRYQELVNGVTKTQIVIDNKAIATKKPDNEAMQKQLTDAESKIAEMQKMIDELKKSKSSEKTPSVTKSKDTDLSEKKLGKPKKTE